MDQPSRDEEIVRAATGSDHEDLVQVLILSTLSNFAKLYTAFERRQTRNPSGMMSVLSTTKYQRVLGGLGVVHSEYTPSGVLGKEV